MGKYKEHGVLIYLNNPLYMGFIKLQADKGLGRSFAGLLAFCTGLFQMGYISKSEYLRFKARYSTPLDKEPQQLTLVETPLQNELNKLDKTFGEVITQWSFHPEQKWREGWIKKAMEYGDLPNAKKLLVLMENKKKKGRVTG